MADSFPVSTISIFSVLTVSLKRTCRFKRITFRANKGKKERNVTNNLAIWSTPSKSLRKEVGLVDKLTTVLLLACLFCFVQYFSQKNHSRQTFTRLTPITFSKRQAGHSTWSQKKKNPIYNSAICTALPIKFSHRKAAQNVGEMATSCHYCYVMYSAPSGSLKSTKNEVDPC